MEVYHFIYLLTGVLLGAGAAWFVAKSKFQNPSNAEEQLKTKELELKLANECEKVDALNAKAKENDEKLQREREINRQLDNQHTRLDADYKNLQETLKTQKEELNQIREKFTAEFKNMANEILEEKSKKFTDQNKIQVGELLKPLGEKIVAFEKKVEESNKESIERNSALKEQIAGFKELNQKITKEAENLVKALKGDTKTQGNWGEFILESILEKSGLEKQREYFVQQSYTDESGKRYQPDVIIKLPDAKSIIVDSKVSLVAYERYINTEDKEEKEVQLKAHINSIRTHVNGLSLKEYQNIYELEGLDFVLLFVPIEPAFSLAVQKDAELFNDAYAKNIVIVSPTTLIATLRTISSIWKQEYQNANAIEIARQGGALYDKFVLFSEDLLKVGNSLKMAKTNYDGAMNKLVEGSGNLIKRVETIKKLGAKATKNLDQKLLERSEED